MNGESERAGETLGATLHHREGAPERRRVQAVLSRMDKLERDGVLDRCACERWPDEVPLDRDSTAVDVFERYRDWADRNGVSIQPPFRVASVESSILHVSDEMLRTPALCLSVRVGDELRAVYPHDRGDEIVTVEQGLRAISTAGWSEETEVSEGADREDAVGHRPGQSVNPV